MQPAPAHLLHLHKGHLNKTKVFRKNEVNISFEYFKLLLQADVLEHGHAVLEVGQVRLLLQPRQEVALGGLEVLVELGHLLVVAPVGLARLPRLGEPVCEALGQLVLVDVLECVLVLHREIPQLLDHLVSCLSLGKLFALSCSCFCVFALKKGNSENISYHDNQGHPHLDDAVNGEHPLVREPLLVVEVVHGRRPPAGHTELLQRAHRVTLDTVIVRGQDLGGQVRDRRLAHGSLASVLSTCTFDISTRISLISLHCIVRL